MKVYIKLLLLFIVSGFILNHFAYGKASANSNIGPGWFTGGYNNHGGGDFVLPQKYTDANGVSYAIPPPKQGISNPVQDVKSFENFIENNYTRTACQNGNWSAVGSAYIIQTMRNPAEDSATMNRFGASADFHNCPTQGDIADWENLLSYYDTSSANHIGGFNVRWDVSDSSCQNSMNLNDHLDGSDTDPVDDADYRDTNPDGSCISYSDVIEFVSSGNVNYVIKYTCANPVGGIGLTLPNWQLQGTTYLNGKTTDQNVPPPATQNFASDITNTGPDDMPSSQQWEWKVEGCYYDPSSSSNNCTPSDKSTYSPKHCGQGGDTSCNNPCPDGSQVCLPTNLSANGIAVNGDKPNAGSDHESGNSANQYTFPSTASVGTEFCEVIAYTYANGPGDSTVSYSNKVCAHYLGPTTTTITPSACTLKSVAGESAINGTPGGTVTLNGTDDGTGHLASDTNNAIFNHQINNNGSCTVTIAWQVNGSYSAGATTFGSTHCGGSDANGAGASYCDSHGGVLPGSGGNVTVAPGHNAPSYASGNAQNSYHFPIGAPNGATYCQDISYSGDLSGDTSGGKACVKLVLGSGPGGSSGTCPGDNKINSNTIVTIGLQPDMTPGPGAHSGPNPPGTYNPSTGKYETTQSADQSRPTTWYQNVSEHKTNATSAQDASSGGSSVPLSIYSQDQSNETASVDYTPFINDYPYDYNKASVTYYNYYDTTIWNPSGPTYTCNSGDPPPNGTTCSHDTGQTPSCSNYSVHQSGDSLYDYNGTCYSYYFSTKNAQGKYNACSPGYAGPNSSTGECAYTLGPDQCPSGTTASGGRCYTQYAAWATYTWNKTGQANGQQSPSNTVNGYTMNPCYPRQYSVAWANSSGAYQPSDEDPTSASFGGTVAVTISGSPGASSSAWMPLRQSTNLNFSESGSSSSPGTSSCGGSGAMSVSSSQFGTVNQSAPPFSCTVHAGNGGLEPGDRVCAELDVRPQQGTYDPANSPPQQGSGTASAFPCTGPLQDQPYVQFLNGDVAAGGVFDSSNNQCLSGMGGNGTIEAFVRGSGALTRGSGTQLAAVLFNSSSRSQFDSATLRSAVPKASNGLAFATSSGIGSGQCVPNYMATDPHDPGNSPLSGSTAVDNLSGTYDASGTLTITGGTVRNSTAIYAGSGDVHITGDITYAANGGWVYNLSDHSSNVPSLYIVTSGNIYIDPGVKNLDAILIAQQGTIYTCGNVADYDSCNSQLTINGALIAKQVKFLRTWSSLRDSAQGEYPDAASPSSSQCDLGDNGQFGGQNPNRTGGVSLQYDCAAEIILFSPEIYLNQPAFGGTGSGPVKYDYITSLSPVL